MAQDQQKNVLILYKSMPQYRVEFFLLLKEKLKESGIHLTVLYGDIDSKGKSDTRQIECGEFVPNRFIRIGGMQLIWQPVMAEVKKADLVIVEQANKLLVNYVLLARKFFLKKKFAFWGHGVNMQIEEGSVFNKFKKLYSNYTDHWFAYTTGVKQRLVANGFKNAVTVVENAIDTSALSEYYHSITASEAESLKRELQIEPDDTVFIYCGALYKEKRIGFLVEVGDTLQQMGIKFKLVVVGGGPDAPIVEEAVKTRPWLKSVGPKFGREKALYFKISDLFLMPGAIGLAILDSFALSTPMITTEYPFHGPEYEYLIHDYNGIITKDSKEAYIDGIIKLIGDKDRMEYLTKNCRESSKQYTVENMVNNFSEGVIDALK